MKPLPPTPPLKGEGRRSKLVEYAAVSSTSPLPFRAPHYPHLDIKKYHLTSERSNVGRKAKNEDSHDLGEVERLFLAPDLGRFDPD